MRCVPCSALQPLAVPGIMPSCGHSIRVGMAATQHNPHQARSDPPRLPPSTPTHSTPRHPCPTCVKYPSSAGWCSGVMSMP